MLVTTCSSTSAHRWVGSSLCLAFALGTCNRAGEGDGRVAESPSCGVPRPAPSRVHGASPPQDVERTTRFSHVRLRSPGRASDHGYMLFSWPPRCRSWMPAWANFADMGPCPCRLVLELNYACAYRVVQPVLELVEFVDVSEDRYLVFLPPHLACVCSVCP